MAICFFVNKNSIEWQHQLLFLHKNFNKNDSKRLYIKIASARDGFRSRDLQMSQVWRARIFPMSLAPSQLGHLGTYSRLRRQGY